MNDIERRIVRHNAFWEKKPVERPLIVAATVEEAKHLRQYIERRRKK